jgi:4-amino-4-deoxy-L-arabinose transferase-like glycosyltransferase
LINGRRRLLAIVVLAAVLHALGIARTVLPAQDGLKFIRVARQFQERPAIDVIRGSDRHPLYPALIAVCEPFVAWFTGPGPDAWRIAAQGVAALASIVLILPLYGLTRALFDDRIAALAALLFVVLPLPAEVGRDTLSDSLGLLAALAALQLGAAALAPARRGFGAIAGCGLAAGVGYLARPEVALVPLAVAITLLVGGWRPALRRRVLMEMSTLGVAFLTLVGGYALAKGEVSESLALRHGAGIAPPRTPVRLARPWLPPGLDDPRWDFSPKEETLPGESRAPGRSRTSAVAATVELITRWAEGLGGFFGLFAIWGAVRARFVRALIAGANVDSGSGQDENALPPRLRMLLTIYLVLYALVLVRHQVTLGYLSDRHLLPLVAVAMPWTAAGTYVCARRAAAALGWPARRTRVLAGVLVMLAAISALVMPQWKPGHRSRWGHWAAGCWLQANARTPDAVLDTRGWASFASNRPSYDYWHVRQALTDPYLAYIVVGADELSAASRRAATLRAVLAYSATPVATFPDDRDGESIGVLVYRYRRPHSWEGLRP